MFLQAKHKLFVTFCNLLTANGNPTFGKKRFFYWNRIFFSVLYYNAAKHYNEHRK